MVIVLLMAFLVACDQPAAPAAIPRETVADPTFSLSSEGGNLDITQENFIMVTTASFSVHRDRNRRGNNLLYYGR